MGLTVNFWDMTPLSPSNLFFYELRRRFISLCLTARASCPQPQWAAPPFRRLSIACWRAALKELLPSQRGQGVIRSSASCGTFITDRDKTIPFDHRFVFFWHKNHESVFSLVAYSNRVKKEHLTNLMSIIWTLCHFIYTSSATWPCDFCVVAVCFFFSWKVCAGKQFHCTAGYNGK